MTARISFVYNQGMRDPENSQKKRPPMTARNKMMDYLARRDHSEKELRQKLRERFPQEEIDQAIEFGKEKGWIPTDTESAMKLSEKSAEFLHRRGKGIRYINAKLYERGLPPISSETEDELEKAQSLVKTKFPHLDLKDKKAQGKVGRFLVSRGFDLDIVRKVIYEK
ncbi:MAG: recombination regulator RecX [Proteobacteria bacterium]|jgi:regulatory protein|nr:recombination regulator RecX [Pseudomonadota bacterium]